VGEEVITTLRDLRRKEGTTVQLLGLTGGLVTSSGILPGIEN
jgi:hypothetical protein